MLRRRAAGPLGRGVARLAQRRRLGSSSSRNALERFASTSQTPVGMRALIDTGLGKVLSQGHGKWKLPQAELNLDDGERRRLARIQIASFLRKELPVRFAHRARELSRVPFELGEMPSIQEVKHWYEQSFEEVMEFEEKRLATDQDAHENFRAVLESIFLRHQDTLVMIAKGLYEFKESETGQRLLEGQDLADIPEIHEYFDRFFLSRIGIRILIGHYLELYEEPKPDFVGMICVKTSAAQVARAAAEDAKYMCERHFGDAPEVEFLGRVDLTFPYIPSHLYYILFELLKNSMRAVAEFHDLGNMPDIRVVIADGEDNEDVVIRISDRGGGIPRSISRKVFSYLFTTAPQAFPANADNLEDFGTENPLAGLGYGLPISRSYVRYFRGELSLMSMEGYGTDAFVHLPRLADNENQPLV